MSALTPVSEHLLDAARMLQSALSTCRFGVPVAHVYQPLDYAWAPYAEYVRRYGNGPRRLVFLGMNPGPFGMMQTGVPFGEVAAVRDWMGVSGRIEPPAHMHARRPIEGFDCARSEVSGRRLWGWAAARWGDAEAFFREAFVLNYCPLVWLEASGRNRTPEQLPAAELAPVTAACDQHLARALSLLAPQWAIGVGGYAEARLKQVLQSGQVDPEVAASLRITRILHPSPASPAANRGWAEAVDAELTRTGVLPPPHAAP